MIHDLNHGSAIRLRLANTADIDALADLRWRLCTDDQPLADPKAKKDFVAAFRAELPDVNDHHRQSHFLAEFDGQIIAALSIVRVNKIPAPNEIKGQWGYLTNVYTLPAFRNRGIGSALINKALQWATTEALELLAVWPSDRSYVFYERVGFRREADPLILKI